jgi:death on curing protein
VRFLTVANIERFHDRLLERTGGETGLLNPTLLHAAVDRCEWGPFPGPPTLALRAAFLLRGICQDHPFVDGNKRTAFEAADQFMRINGASLQVQPRQGIAFMLVVATGRVGLEEIKDWIQVHAREVS